MPPCTVILPSARGLHRETSLLQPGTHKIHGIKPPLGDRVIKGQDFITGKEPYQQTPAGARVHRLAHHLTEHLTPIYAAYGLSEGEFDILCAIHREGEPFEIRPADIAKTTMVTTGGTSKRLDRLEKSGLVERVPHKTGDGRSKLVRLTPQGKATIEKAFKAHMENERVLVQSLDAEDQVTLERILKQWLSSFEGK